MSKTLYCGGLYFVRPVFDKNTHDGLFFLEHFGNVGWYLPGPGCMIHFGYALAGNTESSKGYFVSGNFLILLRRHGVVRALKNKVEEEKKGIYPSILTL